MVELSMRTATFWDRAAVCSFLAPIVGSAAGWFALDWYQRRLIDDKAAPILTGVFLVLVVSFVVGMLSVLTFRSHAWKISVWLALAGMLVAGFVGYCDGTLLLMVLFSPKH